MDRLRNSRVLFVAGLGLCTGCGPEPIATSPSPLVASIAPPAANPSTGARRFTDWPPDRSGGWYAVVRSEKGMSGKRDDLRLYPLDNGALVHLWNGAVARISNDTLSPTFVPIGFGDATLGFYPSDVTGTWPDALFVRDVDPTSGATWFRLSKIVGGAPVPVISNELNMAGMFVTAVPWTRGRTLAVTGNPNDVTLVVVDGDGNAPVLPPTPDPSCRSQVLAPFGLATFPDGEVLMLAMTCVPSTAASDWRLVSVHWSATGAVRVLALPRPSDVPTDVIIEAYPGAYGPHVPDSALRERQYSGAEAVGWRMHGLVAQAADDVTVVGEVDSRPYLAHFGGRSWRELEGPTEEPPVDIVVAGSGWSMTSGSKLWRHRGGTSAGPAAATWESRPLPLPAKELRGIWQAPNGRLWLAAGSVIWSDTPGSTIYEVAFEVRESDEPLVPRVTPAPRTQIHDDE